MRDEEDRSTGILELSNSIRTHSHYSTTIRAMKRAPFPQSPLSFQNETLPNLSLQNETLPNDTCIGFQNLLDVQLDEDELLNETIGLESRGEKSVNTF